MATRFRIWATQTLREYVVKGFVLDDERLKNPDQPFDYFDAVKISHDMAKYWAESDMKNSGLTVLGSMTMKTATSTGS